MQLALVMVLVAVFAQSEASQVPSSASIPCGYVKSSNRIEGGRIPGIDDFPWTALLFYGDGDSSIPGCGGVLISNSVVLTAARCLIDGTKQKKNLTFVRLGEYDLASNPDCINYEDGEYKCYSTQVDVKAKNIIIHPGFQSNAANQHHDIALIELEQPVKYTSFIQPICLPDESFETSAERNFTVAGWGLTDHFRNQGFPTIFSPIKLMEDLQLFDRQACQDVYGSQISLGSDQFCVDGELSKDSCQRSPGSPLMTIVKTAERSLWVLVGLVGLEMQECERKPGIYTNVKQYIGWIEANA